MTGSLKIINRCCLILCLALFAVSFFQKNRLPSKDRLHPWLYQEPIQTETGQKPFDVRQGSYLYHVEPLYDYALCGLVVSCHDSSDWWDIYHAEWKDSLNLKDFCVTWGENVKSGIYEKVRFKSGSFTCWWSACHETAKQFKKACMSNNHLITADAGIRRQIRQAEAGDQICFRGYLAKYAHSHGQGFKRGSSITREDEGPGACETIYVTEFKMVQPANTLWRLVYTVSGYGIVLGIIFGIVLFFKTPLRL